VRERILPKVKNGVPVNAKIRPWRAAVYANLCVSLHTDGSIGLRRFRRCAFARKTHPSRPEWHKSLPEIGSRAKLGPTVFYRKKA
jgi:hypothetical protein